MMIDKEIEKTITNIKVNRNKKNVLILSGGSFKGFAYIGVVKALKYLDLLKNINVFIGTSVGSIFSLLLSLTSCIEEIETFINKCDLNSLLNTNIKNLFYYYGLNDGNKITSLLSDFLKQKNYNETLTFKELYEQTNKILVVNSTNITKKQNEIFNFYNTPDFEVIKAIRMSISIPLLFSPVAFGDCLYVDGGIIDSFMYSYGIKEYGKDKIIGVLLNDKINKEKKYNFFCYFQDIYYSLYANQTKEINFSEIINIEIDNCSITKTTITETEKKDLIDLGFKKTLEYFI